ncbi:hypothetical protein [Rhodococcus sp. B50]|uniref:hypothetical protein n=1 Tax=Rhodococcus sp. B50 TaxID=2682847 RepID=UPI001BD3751F|nr:hypothetical protein [Rhodococcus sp. B50]
MVEILAPRRARTDARWRAMAVERCGQVAYVDVGEINRSGRSATAGRVVSGSVCGVDEQLHHLERPVGSIVDGEDPVEEFFDGQRLGYFPVLVVDATDAETSAGVDAVQNGSDGLASLPPRSLFPSL